MDNAIINQVVIAIVAFSLGNVSGYMFHDVLKRSLGMNEESSKNFLLLVITVIWAISMIVDILSPNYDVPVAVHGIMGAVVGFFFYRPKGGDK